MLKKILSCIFITGILIVSISAVSVNGLAGEEQATKMTTEEKLEDFAVLYQFINENCPYLPVMEEARRNWYNRKEEFEQLLRDTETDREYYHALNRILRVLGNNHTNIISPDYYYHLLKLPLSGPWRQVLQQEEISSAYRYWEEVLEGDEEGAGFLARYIAGGYWVLYSAFPQLPEGAQILTVNGRDVDRYVMEKGAGLYQDPVRDKKYARFLPVPEGELKISFVFNNLIGEVVVAGRVAEDRQVKSVTPPSQANISSRILKKGRAAYLRVASFSHENIASDREKIRSFLKEIIDYPYLIIDIRGNGGGDDSYWQDLLVSPLLDQPLMTSFYVFYRSGEYVQPFINSTLGPGKAFMRVGRNTLLKKMGLPEGFLSAQYMDPLKLPYLVRPENPVGFRGEIILLVDNLVYSSAESFAAFARATGWATIAGTKTGGDGIGFTPIELKLPNSGLLVRIPMTVGLNPDGSINIVGQTTPDIFLDYEPGDYLKIWNGEMEPGEDRMVQEVLSLISSEEFQPVQPSSRGLLTDFFQDYDGDYGYPVEEGLERFNGLVIDGVKIVGAFDTDRKLLRRVIDLKAGDEFSAEAVRLAGERLEVLNAHTSVTLDVKPVSERRVEVTVFIQEGVGFALSPVSLSRNVIEDIIDNRISYTHYNLGGRMINIKGVLGLGPAEERHLTLSGPLLAGIPSKAALSLGTYRDMRQIKQGAHRGSSYSMRSNFLAFSDLISTGPGSQLVLGIDYLRERVDRVESGTGLILKDRDYLRGSVTLNKGGYCLEGGLLADIGEAGVFYPYITIAGRRELALSKKLGLYMRGGAGWKRGETPINHLFFTGGPESFAAYNPDSLLADRYLSGGMELRRYFTDDLYLALFIDGGGVWQPGEELQLSSPLSGVGLAARYRTPIGLVLEGLYAVDPGRAGQQRLTFGLDTDF